MIDATDLTVFCGYHPSRIDFENLQARCAILAAMVFVE